VISAAIACHVSDLCYGYCIRSGPHLSHLLYTHLSDPCPNPLHCRCSLRHKVTHAGTQLRCCAITSAQVVQRLCTSKPLSLAAASRQPYTICTVTTGKPRATLSKRLLLPPLHPYKPPLHSQTRGTRLLPPQTAFLLMFICAPRTLTPPLGPRPPDPQTSPTAAALSTPSATSMAATDPSQPSHPPALHALTPDTLHWAAILVRTPAPTLTSVIPLDVGAPRKPGAAAAMHASHTATTLVPACTPLADSSQLQLFCRIYCCRLLHCNCLLHFSC
jgi:hypothetical protein